MVLHFDIYVTFIIILVFVILLYIPVRMVAKKESYYFNPYRKCLQYGKDYPSYWSDQYGKDGDNWPYKKKIDEYNKQPTQCGGCWATPSPVSMFK